MNEFIKRLVGKTKEDPQFASRLANEMEVWVVDTSLVDDFSNLDASPHTQEVVVELLYDCPREIAEEMEYSLTTGETEVSGYL